MMHAFGAIINDSELLTTVQWVLGFIIGADIFYFITSLTLYITLVHRLYITFNHSMYQISNHFLWLIACFIAVQALVMIAFILEIVLFNCEPTIWCKVEGYLSVCIAINDYILNAALFVLFIWRLRQLIALRMRYNFGHINLDRKSVVNRDRQTIRLLDVITKQSIIRISLTFVNQMFASVNFVVFMLPPGDWNTYLCIVYLVRGAEGVFACVLLYLGLSINDEEYKRICGSCHGACYHCCVMTTSPLQISDQYYQM